EHIHAVNAIIKPVIEEGERALLGDKEGQIQQTRQTPGMAAQASPECQAARASLIPALLTSWKGQARMLLTPKMRRVAKPTTVAPPAAAIESGWPKPKRLASCKGRVLQKRPQSEYSRPSSKLSPKEAEPVLTPKPVRTTRATFSLFYSSKAEVKIAVWTLHTRTSNLHSRMPKLLTRLMEFGGLVASTVILSVSWRNDLKHGRMYCRWLESWPMISIPYDQELDELLPHTRLFCAALKGFTGLPERNVGLRFDLHIMLSGREDGNGSLNLMLRFHRIVSLSGIANSQDQDAATSRTTLASTFLNTRFQF
ncbi:hypothetical protein AC579_1921, partial [Pseudocercospora musae]